MLICPLQFDIQYTGLSTKTSGHALSEHRAANFDKLTLHSTGTVKLVYKQCNLFLLFWKKNSTVLNNIYDHLCEERTRCNLKQVLRPSFCLENGYHMASN